MQGVALSVLLFLRVLVTKRGWGKMLALGFLHVRRGKSALYAIKLK